jgi:tRNA-specific adenosine deaminase 1
VCEAHQKILQAEALQGSFTSVSKVPEPSKRELRIHALTQGIPFIGFGIMDNAILIWAGDQIDTHLGVILGISTLCAAAIGNIISDLAGLGLGAYVEDFCATKLNLPKINLTNAQRNLRSVRMAGQWGNCIGLTIGCIIGMFPLLFIDPDEAQFRKQDAKIFGIFRDVMNEAKTLIGAESTCLFMVVDDDKSTIPAHYNRKLNSTEKEYLYGKYCCIDKKTKKRICVPVGRGIISKAIMSGELLNVVE